MDIRKSYYDPEMVKNLSVMLRLSPEEVINKLWSNRVPTTITKAMTTEEMLAKNPDSVLSELHAADDKDHADLERRAASRIDPQLLRVDQKDTISQYESRNPKGSSPPNELDSDEDDEIYALKRKRGPDHGIIGYDSKGDEHESPSSVARSQEEEEAEVKRQRETAMKVGLRYVDLDGEERAPARPRPSNPRLRRSFYPENVARAFAGNPYVGQEFDPATLAGLSRLTGMPVEEVAFRMSKSNDDESADKILQRREAAAEGLGEGKSPLTRRLEGMARNVGPSQHGRGTVIDESADKILQRREAAAEGLGEGKSPLTRRLEGMARNVGPSQRGKTPENKDKPEMNLEKARQISSMMGIPLDEVLRKLAKAQGIEWEVSKSGGETYGKDPDETTNPAENTTAERPATNSFDPGTREGVLNRKSTEIDGKQYNMNTAANAAIEAARAQGNANLDPSEIESIQDDSHKLNAYVNRQGVRTGESTRNLNIQKSTNKLPNRAPERDNLNLSLVDVFYGRTMSKSKKKINRG